MQPTNLKLFLISVLLLTGFSLSALTVERNGIKYDLDSTSKTATATGVDASLVDGVVEGMVAHEGVDYTVTAIADRGFFICRNLRTIILPSTLRSVGTFAFLANTALERVDIPALTDWLSIEFADGFSNPLVYGHDLYVGGEKLEQIVLPDGLAKVPDNAFVGASIKSVTFPDALTEIGQLSFYECTSLTDINGGKHLTTVGLQAFDGCSALKSISLSPSVTTIANYAFNGCSSLETVKFGASVESVGDDAFAGCDALKSVDVTDIGAWCKISFANSKANPLAIAHVLTLNGTTVTNLEIPDGIAAVSDGAFAGCTAIESVVTGKDVTTIGEKAFNSCPKLKSVAFNGPVSSIGDYAFEGCPQLTDCELPATLTMLGEYAFYGTGLTAASVPDGVTALADGTFGECVALASVTLSEGLTSIGFGSFYGCESLTEVTVPESVTKIGKSAFNGCRALRTIRLGQSLTTLSSFAFGGCPALSDIYVAAVEPPVAPESAFSTYTATLRVPASSIPAYKADATWGRFASIEVYDNSVNDLMSDGQSANSDIEVYTLDGRRIYRGSKSVMSVPSGTYVIRTSKGATVTRF